MIADRVSVARVIAHRAGQRVASEVAPARVLPYRACGVARLDAVAGIIANGSVPAVDGERVAEAGAELTSAHLLYQRGAFPAALSKYQHALELARITGEARLEGDALCGIGWMNLQLEDYGSAQASLEDALSLHRAVQDTYGEMLDLTSLGVLARRRNRLAESVRVYEDALARSQLLGDRHFEGKLQSNLGVATRFQGRYGTAAEHLTSALSIFHEQGLPPNLEIALGELGLLALALGDLSLARTRLEEALTIALK